MKIDEYINSLDFVEALPAVHALLTKAQESVSFWGTRVISVKGYDGSFSLDEVAKKVFLGGIQRCNLDNLTIAERVEGLEIVDKLRHFYRVTDTKISQANCFTRLLNCVREFTFSPYTPRFHTEQGSMRNYFRAYSEARFCKEIGGAKTTYGLYVESDGVINSDGIINDRILAREAAIRKLSQLKLVVDQTYT